jgi:hypothetical protein
VTLNGAAALFGLIAGTWEKQLVAFTLMVAARYSFCSRSSWFTDPVTYASSRTHFLFFILIVHLNGRDGRLEFLDHTASISAQCYGASYG